ncbi:partial D-inositol 3-phosphate glycosyltransferase, partial [Anaerolineae bacterium]
MNITALESHIPKVIIQYNCIAHYRKPIFELLSACADVEFNVVADSKTDSPFMKVVDIQDSSIRGLVAKRWDIRLGNSITLFWQPDAIKVVLRKKPDVIIALGNPYSLTAWALIALGSLLGIPTLLWGHGLLTSESGPKWWLRRFFYSLAHGQLLYSDYAKELLIKQGFDPNRLFVVYNSLDYDAQTKAANEISEQDCSDFRTALGVKPNDGMVVFTGRLQKNKKLDLLIQAVALLAGKGNSVHIVLVGEGPERANLQNQAAKLGISHLLHFLGESYDERKIGLAIGASDLCVIPSGAGLSVMHAMAFGTPVMLHDNIAEHF